MADLNPSTVTSTPLPPPVDRNTPFAYRVADIVRLVISTVLALLGLVILNSVLAGMSPHFADVINARNILLQVGIVGVVAVGMTFLILNRDIDLSVGSMAVLAGVVAAKTLNDGGTVGAAVSAAITLGLVGGFAQGLVITVLGIPSYIVTLGGLTLFSGVALLTTGGTPAIIRNPDYMNLIGLTSQGMPGVFTTFLVIAVAAQIVQVILYLIVRRMQRASLAAALSADTPNPSTNWTPILVRGIGRLAAFTLMGVLAALGGVYVSARLSIAQPGIGNDWALLTIAAIAIGGVSVFSGKGWFVSTIIGMLIVVTLQNGAILLNVPTYGQTIYIVTAFAGVVVFNRLLEMLLNWIARRSPGLNRPLF